MQDLLGNLPSVYGALYPEYFNGYTIETVLADIAGGVHGLPQVNLPVLDGDEADEVSPSWHYGGMNGLSI
jgi:hypothetical protein